LTVGFAALSPPYELPAEAIRELPLHINDNAFADACADAMIGFLRR
jgi:hypothetical protein